MAPTYRVERDRGSKEFPQQLAVLRESGEAVPQGVRRDPVGQSRPFGRHVAYPVELARGHRADAVAAGKHPDGGTRDAPPVSQQL